MTRKHRLEALATRAGEAITWGARVADGTNMAHLAYKAGHAGNLALDHLAVLEQAAITAYLAEVPLPEGWREERDGLGGREWPVVRYLEAVQGLDTPVERAFANKATIHVNTMPAHWPAIPQAVLIRAAVQCHRLREGQ